MRILLFVFWLAWIGVHGFAAYGAQGSGGWLGSIASDGWLLLVEFDAALFVALVLLVAAGRKAALLTWLCGFTAMAMAFGHVAMIGQVGFSSSMAAHAAEPSKEDAGASGFTLMQGNTESKGNPLGWNYDVVVLCEVGLGGGDDGLAEKAAEAGMTLAVGPVQGKSDAAIYTRFPVVESGSVGEPIDGWSQGSWAKISTAGGEVLVVSVHTRSPTSLKWARARDEFFVQLDGFLASQPKDLPIVVSGDMNATPDNAGFRTMISKAKWSQEPDAWRPTWHSRLAEHGMGFRIDRTLGKQGAAVAKWAPLKRGPSDHLFSSSLIRIER